MLFCPICKKALEKDTSTMKVLMKCKCGKVFEGDPEDTLIAQSFDPMSGKEGYKSELLLAPFDRVNSIVKTECKACKRKYMTRVVTDHQSAMVCACGTIYPLAEF